jgi:hypothetical protein
MSIKEQEEKTEEEIEEDEIKEDEIKENEIKEDEIKEEEKKEREKKKKEREREDKLKEYSKIVNYPGMNVRMQVITETDDELFNNLFNENHVIYQNNIKRYLFCSTLFITYTVIGYMYYYFIYSN